MISEKAGLLDQVRARFAYVDSCPFQGPRVFFENAGGALTLKTVVETSAKYAAIPDNQGRDNPTSHKLVDIINASKAKMRTLFNVSHGQVFVGESGTELINQVAGNQGNLPPAGGRQITGCAMQVHTQSSGGDGG